jgi:hypothetical protein
VSGPSIVELLGLIPEIRSTLNAALAILEAASPDAAHASEEQAAAILQAALDKLNVTDVASSLDSLKAVLAAGRGISGGGFDSNLA